MLKSPRIPNLLTWEFFVQDSRAKYVIDMYRESKWKQFLNMKQMNLSVAEYEKELSHLSKYAPEAVLTEAFRCMKFEDGLHDSIKRYLALVTSLQQVKFYQLLQDAMKVERLEIGNKEKSQNKKFSKGASFSYGKRAIDIQVESVQGSTIRGRRQGGATVSSAGRGALVG